jgi:hypothetical protein
MASPATQLLARRTLLVRLSLALAAIVVVLAVAIVVVAVRRPVAWGVDGNRLTALSTPVPLTANVVEEHCERLVGLLETWGYPDVANVPDRFSDYLDPSLVPEMRSRYTSLATEAARARLYRAAIATSAVIISRDIDLWTVLVWYRETTWVGGVSGEGYTPSTAAWKVARLQVSRMGATGRNPLGLRLTRRFANATRQEYQEARKRDSSLPELSERDQVEIFTEDPEAKKRWLDEHRIPGAQVRGSSK